MIDARDSDRAHPIGTEKKPFPIPYVRRPRGQHRDTNCLTPFRSAQRRCLIPASHRRPRTAPAKPARRWLGHATTLRWRGHSLDKSASVRPHAGRKAVQNAPPLEQCAASRGPPASLGDGMPAGIPDVCLGHHLWSPFRLKGRETGCAPARCIAPANAVGSRASSEARLPPRDCSGRRHSCISVSGRHALRSRVTGYFYTKWENNL